MEHYFQLLIYFWYMVFFVLIILLYVLNSMEHQSEFKGQKRKVSPKFNGPHLLSFLMYKKITPNVFSSTVLILIKKGAITVKEKNSVAVFTNTSKNIKLSSSQKYLIDMLFNIVSPNEELTLEDIIEYSKNNYKCSMFLIDFQIWKKMMYKEVSNNHYYEEKTTYKIINVYKNMTFIVLGLNYLLKVNSFNGYFIIIPAYFLLLSFYYVYKRTPESNDEYYKWLAFKKHLSTEETSHDYLIQAIILNASKSYAENSDQTRTLAYQLHLALGKLIKRSALYGNRSFNASTNKWH